MSKKYKAKFILEIRDLWPDTWVEMGAITQKSLTYKIFAWLEKILYQKSDKIIGLMPGIEVFQTKGIKLEKVIWISNGVDLDTFDLDYKRESVYKFNKEKINFVYTGSIGIANALDNIFKVALKLKNNNKIIFNIIGDGPLKEEYQNFIKENHLNNIKIYNTVSKNQVPALLREADILLVTTKKTRLYKYGISFNKIFEYLAAKKPILISYDTEYDFIGKSNCGFVVEAENEKELIKKIEKIIEIDKNELKKIGENSRKVAEQYFDMKILVKKLEKIIEEKL